MSLTIRCFVMQSSLEEPLMSQNPKLLRRPYDPKAQLLKVFFFYKIGVKIFTIAFVQKHSIAE